MPLVMNKHRRTQQHGNESLKTPFSVLSLSCNACSSHPKERDPGDPWPRIVQQPSTDYWLGRRSCVNPVVLMSRNIGVRGGRSVGVRKFTSNW
jgi:hypothetical protein